MSAASTSPQPHTPPIGAAERDVLALAFGGGGFGTAMQLGVVHALLVSDGQAPDVVAGISAGAVNAAALAEILQAGEPSDPKRREAQVARFREFLELFQQAPELLLQALLPDPYEVSAQRPLAPIELPVHFQQERRDRNQANRERAGLIDLINHLLAIRLPVRVLTQLIRCALGYAAAGDKRRWQSRLLLRGQALARIWWLLFNNFLAVAPIVGTIAWANVRGLADRLLDRTSNGLKTTGAWLEASLRKSPWRWLGGRKAAPAARRLLYRLAQSADPAQRKSGATAGSLVLGLLALRKGLRSAARSFVALLTLALLVAVPFTLIGILVRVLASVLISALGTLGTGQTVSPAGLRAIRLALPFAPIEGDAWLLWVTASGLLIVAALWLSRLSEKLLSHHSLLDSLASPHPLREMFVRLFDPNYYGLVDLEEILTEALTKLGAVPGGSKARKTLSHYVTAGDDSIRVAPVAADLQTGELKCLPPDTAVVDALLAATAVTPLLPAQRLPPGDGGRYYIDGLNVANEPTSVLMDLLRREVHPEARRVQIYAVTSLPISQLELPAEKPDLSADRRDYPGLVSVIVRVLDLKRFRDATLEHQLGKLYTALIDRYVQASQLPDRAAVYLEDAGRSFVRADLHSIEPDRPLDLNERVARAESPEQRRRAIREGVAEGCRAALEAMIQPAIAQAASREPLADPDPGSASCHRAIAMRLPSYVPLSASDPQFGPGVTEVCQACALNRIDNGQRHVLRARDDRSGSLWPLRGAAAPTPGAGPPPSAVHASVEEPAAEREPADTRLPPETALLFSGGVFRGVFQMGVITALSELSAERPPSICAGASVGAITAAMAGRLFKETDATLRLRRLRLLAATYLALDRLVLTDRFTDFVRRFTLRAAGTDLSLADVDGLLRRYDHGAPDIFDRRARRVIAGLERLFYLTPFELFDVVRDVRLDNRSALADELKDIVQYFLERFDVGQELLGSEPLSLLITQHVLAQATRKHETFGQFRCSARERVRLLAVASNLTLGRLDTLPVLDEHAAGGAGEDEVVLLQGLLASSAFPGVFRTRWSWEIFPRTSNVHRYVDGGVMDNLPLDAVVSYLEREAKASRVARRPVFGGRRVPHLLFTASLEPRIDPLGDASAVARQWTKTWARAKQFSYNRKADSFRAAQRRFRLLYEATPRDEASPPDWEPLDIEVVTVKPKWLCSTFGFHPMLGFRRRKQAQNIAHGCATTFATIHAVGLSHPEWLAGWGLDALLRDSPHGVEQSFDPRTAVVTKPESNDPKIKLWPEQRLRPKGWEADGRCWFRNGARCPFSYTAEERRKEEERRADRRKREEPARIELREELHEELHAIYAACGRNETHRARPAS